ncbi:MAG TPA: cytochrome c biogenesis protein CcsA, partial [Thermoanaerobaculia bacterium]
MIRTAREQEPPVMIVYVLSFLGIVAILAKQPPFRFLAQIPPDGQGLNPLLQDPWMVIHPPVMFAGFASLSVPFAFAIAAMWKKRWDGWVVRAMPWALFTLVTLGTAILMGGYWAYKTLGWGGYWAWDPVENTSLVPWLATVALVHGMFLQKTREKHRKINLILAILAFCCILYGTFLTRSGVLADFSVHSFVDLGITGWLVGIIVVFLFGGLGLLAWRWKEIPTEQPLDAEGKPVEEPFLSRSVLFILSVTLFSASGLVILLGTSAPILTRVTGKASQVATSFYTVTHTPIAALIAILIAFVPFVSWKGETFASIGKKCVTALALGLVGGVVAFVAGVRSVKDLVIITAACFGLAANAETIVLFVRRKAIKTMGGYLAHVGVAIMLVGILISGVYERKTQVTLVKGQPVQIGRHTMTFTRAIFVNEDGVVKQAGELDQTKLEDRRAKQAMEVEVKTAGGATWKAYPKMYQNERTKQMMANPDVQSTFLGDLYLSPQAYEPGQPARVQGTAATVKQKEVTTVDGIGFQLVTFIPDRSKMNDARPQVTINGRFKVTVNGKTTDVTAPLVMFIGEDQATQAIQAAIPGTTGSFRLTKTLGADGPAEIEVVGLNTAGDAKPATPENFTVDITHKPLISLVWG